MTLDFTLLQRMFDSLPEAVFVLHEEEILYCNPPGRALLPGEGEVVPYFIELLPKENGELVCTIRGSLFHISVSFLGAKRMLIVRPVRESAPPGSASKIPAQLRLHLASLSVTTEHLAQQLARENHIAPYRDMLAIQTQAACRILRLARQMELADGHWEADYPTTTLDFGFLCRSLAEELLDRTNGQGTNFAFHSDMPSALLQGNRGLLEQLVLALLSNALKSAGPEGRVEMRLHPGRERVLLSVWDSGLSIPEDRLLQIFSPQSDETLPMPNEGAGLDLWISHRIVFFHKGVIMATNRPGGGTEFTVSLPTSVPTKLDLRSQDAVELVDDGFSPLLIALSDALPHQLFDPLDV